MPIRAWKMYDVFNLYLYDLRNVFRDQILILQQVFAKRQQLNVLFSIYQQNELNERPF